ncbi:MAG: GNAT family N-acetyltransferase [Candidatus Lokiarchaeota archaeon]
MEDITFRTLRRDEIDYVRTLRRDEIVEKIFYVENNELILKEEFYDIKGWIPEQLEKNIITLHNLADRGGFLYGAFNNSKLIGIIALECEFIGFNNNQLQVVFLHVDKNYRDSGIGTKLMKIVIEKARQIGAKKLYISATPSKHTINFYFGLGCELTSEINPKLFELEPDDIHLELRI